MVVAGLDEVEIYVARLQNIVVQYIMSHPIMDLYMETERCPEARASKWWWEKAIWIWWVHRRRQPGRRRWKRRRVGWRLGPEQDTEDSRLIVATNTI